MKVCEERLLFTSLYFTLFTKQAVQNTNAVCAICNLQQSGRVQQGTKCTNNCPDIMTFDVTVISHSRCIIGIPNGIMPVYCLTHVPY